MCFGTETKCTFCGAKVLQTGKGRTKDYCSDSCRDSNKFLSAFETAFLKVDSITDGSKREIRSKLWSLANLVNVK